MKNLLVVLALLGLTFFYDPSTQMGLVYINESKDNVIIIVDWATNTMTFYKGVFSSQTRADEGFDYWIKDKNKAATNPNMKAIIQPVGK